MAAVPATPVPFVRSFWLDNNGNKLNGGLLFTYAAGTTTKQNTYTDATSGTANANPVVLDANGRADVFLDPTLAPYKFVLSPSTDSDPPTNAIWTEDNIWPSFNGGAPFTLTAAAVNETSLTLASNATVNIGGAKANYIFISGVTTITSFDTVQSGVERTLEFQGALTLTNNANIILPYNQNITTAAGHTAIFRSEGSAIWRCISYSPLLSPANTIKGNNTVSAASTADLTEAQVAGIVATRSYLAGLALSTAGGSSTMSIAAGVATSDDQTTMMVLVAISKTTSAWVVGSGNGGLDTGSIANGTWYHFYVIERTDTGVVDVIFSLSASAPTLPTNYTKQRRIGSGLTDGSAHWTAFVQNGDDFLWSSTQPTDINGATLTTASRTLYTLSVPPGVKVDVLGRWSGTNVGASFQGTFTSPDEPDLTQVEFSIGANITIAGWRRIRTNTSQQIGIRAINASSTLTWVTAGWSDARGKSN